MFQIHMSGLKRSARPSANTTRVGPPSSIGSTVPSPVRLASAAECVRFERESFGALHQMLAGLAEADREAAWAEIGEALAQFEGTNGFEGPCEMLVISAAR